MDNLTHSVFGAVLAQGFGRRMPHATLTLVLASNAPDVDIVTAFTGGAVGYLAAHRGSTHGPLGFAGLALGTAVLVFGWANWRAHRRGSSIEAPARAFARFLALALVGVTAHGLMDLPTSYGTRILSPFVGTWYAFDWMPIIDVYLWAILLVGFGFMRLRPRASARIAAGTLALMAVDYGGRAALHQRVLTDGAERTAAGQTSACAESPTLARHPRVIEAPLAGPSACIQAAALPTFLSPFSWRVVRQYPHGYEVSLRNALRRSQRGDPVWIPSEGGPVVARARATTTGRVFLDFSRFPAAQVIEADADRVVVRFEDVRFAAPPLRGVGNGKGRSPFTATIALDAAGEVVHEQLGN